MLKYFIVSTTLMFSVIGCSSYNDAKQVSSVVGEIKDTDSWYSDTNYDVRTIKLDIPTPNRSKCASYDNENGIERACTLEDIVHDRDGYDSYKPELSVLISADGLNPTTENATLKLRGDYSRKSTLGNDDYEEDAKVKSYAIKLVSKTDLLWKQRKIQLAKYKSDTTRVKNRLAFDLMREIPNITSIKLQFVNLFINDIDYGLYTNAEAIREEYLVNRGWNKDDKLYNAGNCMFEPLDELRVDAKGQPLNPEAFNTVLEIRTGDDHSNVMKMMQAIYSDTPIDVVIEKYFNRENYITWLAVNLVLSNKDTTYHNFYLYNPLHSETFYFIPWDYDGAWATKNYLGKNEYGISVWWKTLLHKKFMSVPKNLKDIYAKADYLRANYITDEKVREKLALYKESVMKFSQQEPDSLFTSSNSWESMTEKLVVGIENNVKLYKEVIGHPMPFWQALEYKDDILRVVWEKSIDLEGDDIVYDVHVSKDINFLSDDVFNATDIEKLEYSQNIHLEAGIYFLKVISKEKKDPSHYQISFTRARDENNKNTIHAPSSTRFGVLEFEIDENGDLSFENESNLLQEWE